MEDTIEVCFDSLLQKGYLISMNIHKYIINIYIYYKYINIINMQIMDIVLLPQRGISLIKFDKDIHGSQNARYTGLYT
jgi:hypothetical protein